MDLGICILYFYYLDELSFDFSLFKVKQEALINLRASLFLTTKENEILSICNPWLVIEELTELLRYSHNASYGQSVTFGLEPVLSPRP